MKKVDKIFVKVLATIAVILAGSIVVYFATVSNSFDGTWNHTYFPGSILFFCIVGLIGFFIQKKKNRLMKTTVSVLILISLTSCFQERKFKLSDGVIVSVDRIDLDEFIVNDSIWLIRGYGLGNSEWEALDQFTIGEIGFEPKDTTFVFESAAGDYKRRIARAVVIN